MAASAILPFLPMIASGVGELIKGVGTTKAAGRQAELLRGLSAEGKAEIPGLEKKLDQYGIGPSMRKLRQIAAEDPIGDLARQDLERRQATSIGALKAGGAKSLFALPATMTSMGDARRKIDADAFGRMRQALTTVGQAEERVGARKYKQDAADLGAARKQALGYELSAAEAEQARRDAITGMVTGGLSTLGSLAAAGAFGDGSPKAAPQEMQTNVSDEALQARFAEQPLDSGIAPVSERTIMTSAPQAAPESLASRQADVSSLSGFPPSLGLYGPGSLDGYSGNVGGITQYPTGAPFRQRTPPMVGALDLPDYRQPSAVDISSSRDIRALLDIIGSGALGNINFAKGGRTKGSFSHDTNDMKIVDKNGKPTGMSVTGNEVVLTPDQQKKVLEQSSYFRSLMKTPRFR